MLTFRTDPCSSIFESSLISGQSSQSTQSCRAEFLPGKTGKKKKRTPNTSNMDDEKLSHEDSFGSSNEDDSLGGRRHSRGLGQSRGRNSDSPERNEPSLRDDDRKLSLALKRNMNKSIPEGWVKVESRSRPGHFSYENVKTGERSAVRPLYPAKSLEQDSPFRICVSYPDTRSASGYQQVWISCGSGEQTFQWLKMVAAQQRSRSSEPRGRLRQREHSYAGSVPYPNYSDVKTQGVYASIDKRLRPFPNEAILTEYCRPGSTVYIRPATDWVERPSGSCTVTESKDSKT